MSRHDELADATEPLRGDGGLDAVAGRVIAEMLRRSHLLRPIFVGSDLPVSIMIDPQRL